MKIKSIAWLGLLFIIFLWLEAAAAQSIVINEFLASNQNIIADEDGDYSDWIELYNAADQSIDLTGYSLTDDSNIPQRWIFPSLSLAPGDFLLIWASGKDRPYLKELHTNFKLKNSGEFIGLYDAAGNPVDSLSFGGQTTDISCGRSTDASLSWDYFKSPTPGSSNNNATPLVPYPIFSHEQGFHQSSFYLEITSNAAGLKIYYTTNGEIPTRNSQLYSEPLHISATTVIRARCYNHQHQASLTVTKSYFINESVNLPVLSVVMEPKDLWDKSTGIYVNPHKRGDEWERPVHLTLLNPNSELEFTNQAGIRIHGEASRSCDKKSFRLYFRSEYGQSRLHYQIFENRAAEEYKRVILRTASQDNQFGSPKWSLIRCPLFHTLQAEVQPTFCAARPFILFLNGQLWGIYYFRERVDENYLEYNFGIKNGDLIENTPWNYLGEVIVGDKDHWKDAFLFFRDNDLTRPDKYEYAKTLIDIENFTDHHLLNIYGANWDWPHGNVFKFRPRTADGKWQWISWDVDAIFGRSDRAPDPTWPALEWATRSSIRKDLNSSDAENLLWSTKMLRQLLKNQTYRDYFINRYADLLNTTLHEQHIHQIIDSLTTLIAADVHLETERWGSDIQTWAENIAFLKNYAIKRRHYVYQEIIEKFNLRDTITVTIKPNLLTAGTVKINTITQHHFPWQGVYFTGIPISIKAQPNEGFQFIGWKGILANELADSVVFVSDSAVVIEPQFLQIMPPTPPLVINEFLAANNSINQDEFGEFDDWIELYNTADSALYLKNLHLSDNFANPTKWPLPDTTIAAHSFLLIWADGDMSQGPLHTNFKLAKEGEQIGLFATEAQNNIPIDTLTFATQKADTAYGRIKDGADEWAFLDTPTPGQPNIFLPDTSALVIQQLTVDSIDWNRARINWRTNKPANSLVKYGVHVDSLFQIIENQAQVFQHQIVLPNLEPATTYYFQVESIDSIFQQAISPIQWFTTLDTSQLRIYNIVVDNITPTSAKIIWKTNRPAQSVLVYGLEPPLLGHIEFDSTQLTAHEFTLANRFPSTTYFFQIHALTKDGSRQSSAILCFSTLNEGNELDIVYQIELMPYRLFGFYDPPGWNFGDNGEVGQFFNVQRAGIHQFTLNARGKAAGEMGPIFEVSLDDSLIVRDTVTVSAFQTFRTKMCLNSGWHIIKIHFINAQTDSAEIRTFVGDWLHIQYVDVMTDTEKILAGNDLPREVRLQQNYPNPANPETRIRYSIPQATAVSLKIFDLTGREVKMLVNAHHPPGWHTAVWDGRNAWGQPVASGIYLYQLKTNNHIKTKKIIILR